MEDGEEDCKTLSLDSTCHCIHESSAVVVTCTGAAQGEARQPCIKGWGGAHVPERLEKEFFF